MGLTRIACGEDGRAHRAEAIDCHEREIIGIEFALRGRAKEAERAVEEACLRRSGTLRPPAPTPAIRSNNGLIFQSRRFRAACKDYRLKQEFVTPYTPEHNGLIERFFRTLKEERVWQHTSASFSDARWEFSLGSTTAPPAPSHCFRDCVSVAHPHFHPHSAYPLVSGGLPWAPSISFGKSAIDSCINKAMLVARKGVAPIP
jgi:transposase InsO family protein